jgi:hypothetical protein
MKAPTMFISLTGTQAKPSRRNSRGGAYPTQGSGQRSAVRWAADPGPRNHFTGMSTGAITDPAKVGEVVEKFRAKYGAGNVKKYYSKFDVAGEVPLT